MATEASHPPRLATFGKTNGETSALCQKRRLRATNVSSALHCIVHRIIPDALTLHARQVRRDGIPPAQPGVLLEPPGGLRAPRRVTSAPARRMLERRARRGVGVGVGAFKRRRRVQHALPPGLRCDSAGPARSAIASAIGRQEGGAPGAVRAVPPERVERPRDVPGDGPQRRRPPRGDGRRKRGGGGRRGGRHGGTGRKGSPRGRFGRRMVVVAFPFSARAFAGGAEGRVNRGEGRGDGRSDGQRTRGGGGRLGGGGERGA